MKDYYVKEQRALEKQFAFWLAVNLVIIIIGLVI